ncbi:MAG: metalloregulator ArsR/SmtB family transcription factor [Alphaproteobacteria bacterium]|jgi:ubiquinone/menaquinone biosynthesis C-methylase UbiE|nr:metalloregulator ArsR/SmtB family transcription factor [Alphaproteobacteria bacterium]
MDQLLHGLRAAAEPTRLRILALCGHAELSVTELVRILGQSQPRVSRHLKLLVEAELLDRNQEGSRAFYRPASDGAGAELGQLLIDLIPDTDTTLGLDLSRLARIKDERARRAEDYFNRNAGSWEDLRGLYIDDEQIDTTLKDVIERHPVIELLDIGTGTGRVLSLVGRHARVAIGIDNSRDMLDIARANLDRDGLRNCQVRHADMYRLPFTSDRFDLVTANMLVRYADDPSAVLAEGMRVLRPGGRMIIVDFAPHGLAELRDEHAHRWLGFSEAEMTRLLDNTGLESERPVYLEGDPLTVCVWEARKPAEPANDREPPMESHQ